MIKLPNAPARVCAADPNGIVEVPMTNSEEPNEIKVPFTNTADPPGEIDCAPTAKPVGAAVNVSDPILKTDTGGEGKGVVLPLTTSALRPEARENTLPAYVTAGPPGRTLWPPIAKPVAAAVSVWPAITRIGTGGGGTGDVLPFITSAFPSGAKATVVPLTVAALPPALMMSPLARVMIGSADGRAKGMVLLAMTI